MIEVVILLKPVKDTETSVLQEKERHEKKRSSFERNVFLVFIVEKIRMTHNENGRDYAKLYVNQCHLLFQDAYTRKSYRHVLVFVTAKERYM